ncbi:MAG TPA: acireductone synthase [Gemmatimonadales bacterium]|nr:acireductone synthase [Gemmatimonadales bacterium]
MYGTELHPAGGKRRSSTELTEIRAILLDIEGTTTPIEFVHRALFPYARARLHDFLTQHAADPDVRGDIALLRAEYAAEPSHVGRPAWNPSDDRASAEAYVYWLMDRDSKSTGLKSLQGRIWEEGYRTGNLKGKGAVYADVRPALTRWREEGKEIAIFSSGSVQAQRNLFANTTAGDLSAFLSGYFDTTTGPKRAAASYRRIAERLGHPPGEVLFISDVTAELDAAREAGMQTALCVRGSSPENRSSHPRVRSFDELA